MLGSVRLYSIPCFIPGVILLKGPKSISPSAKDRSGFISGRGFIQTRAPVYDDGGQYSEGFSSAWAGLDGLEDGLFLVFCFVRSRLAVLESFLRFLLLSFGQDRL
jgi:hypothetical protein